MLGKLFKHEFKETAKTLVPLNLALILVAFIGNMMLSFDPFGQFPPLQGFVIAFYSLTIFALFILTAVYLTVRFYKTMYASQGYLTHTLPVSTASILNTKITAASFWLLLAVIATVLSLFILGHTGAGIDAASFSSLKSEIETVSQMQFWQFGLLIAAMAIIICISNVLMVCASLSVGQLFRQHRIASAIGAYVVFYMVQQVISVIMLAFLGLSQYQTFKQVSSGITVSFGSFYKWLFLLAIIQGVVLGTIYYVLCYYITGKKLNLE